MLPCPAAAAIGGALSGLPLLLLRITLRMCKQVTSVEQPQVSRGPAENTCLGTLGSEVTGHDFPFTSVLKVQREPS